MKICITAKECNLNAELDPRFGRAQCYLIYDTETKESKIISNESINAAGGAGTAAAQLMTNENVAAVISGNFGPNAAKGLNALNIKMYTSPVEIIRQVIENFLTNKLAQVSNATVEGKHSL